MENQGLSFGTVVRRVVRHLTRSRAISGWVMALACILVFATYPQAWAGYDPVREGSLMAASVALGAIALPELSANLWSVTSTEVRDLIPTNKVATLQRSLLEAQCAANKHDPSWTDAVLNSAVTPLINAAPQQIVRSMTYDVDIHPDHTVEWQGTRREVQLIKTEIRSDRRLSADVVGSVFWIAIARDVAALREEFTHPNCLGREITHAFSDLPDAQWRAAMQSLASARLIVDGRVIEGRQETDEPIGDASERVVRWYFESTELAEATTKSKMVRIQFNYPEDPELRNFAAVLSSYYVIGGLQVRFMLHDVDHAYDLFSDHFLATTLPRPALLPATHRSQVGVETTVVAPDEALVFPGSGVRFWWQPTQPDARMPTATADDVLQLPEESLN